MRPTFLRPSFAVSSCLAGLLAGLLAPAPRAQALLIYDGFDYGVTAATPIGGKDGGLGWSGPWVGVTPAFATLGSWWPLDGAAGDVGPLASHGVEVGNTEFVADTPVPWSSKSLKLENDAYVDLSAHLSKYETMHRGTVAMWVKTTATGIMSLLSFSESTNIILNGRHCTFKLVNGNPSVEMRGDVLSAINPIVAGTKVNDGNWHHVAFVSTGDGRTAIYVDGTRSTVGDEGFIAYVHDQNTAWLGRARFEDRPQWPYTGLIDDVAIWGDALSDADIMSLAQRDNPPIAYLGPRSPAGPNLSPESLATPSFPNAAFTGTGFSPVGNRFSDGSGRRAYRFLLSQLSTQVDQTLYISCLMRRHDNGMPPSGFEVQLGEVQNTACRFGWDTSGRWTAALRTASAVSSVTMAEDTTYFCVFKIVTQGLITNPDNVWLKVYAPGDTVHKTDDDISGIGAGPNQWVVQKTENNNAKAFHVLLTQLPNAGAYHSTAEVDELRIGPTWQSVTRHVFRNSCLGLRAGRSGRAAIGTGNLQLRLSGASPNVPAFLILGQSTLSWFGNTLPLAMGPFGAPGCDLNVSLDFYVPAMTTATGTISLPLFIPNDPRLVGFTRFVQWLAADAAQTNPLPVAFSEAMVVQVEK
jgi:hypothetical protein